MSNDDKTQEANTDIGHEVGEHNIQVMGLDVHNPVFMVSAVLAVTVVDLGCDVLAAVTAD